MDRCVPYAFLLMCGQLILAFNEADSNPLVVATPEYNGTAMHASIAAEISCFL